jgi:outer membrane protein, heavy metal efflux system
MEQPAAGAGGGERRRDGAGRGVPGLAGLEGQAVLSSLVPFGGDRGAAIALATAESAAARSAVGVAEADVRLSTLRAVAEAERDLRLVRHAEEERRELQRFATLLARAVDQGRYPAGHGARAELAAVQAGAEEARRRAAAAASGAELARLLGLRDGSVVRVSSPVCTPPEPARPGGAVPDEAVAAARLEAADADSAGVGRLGSLIPP